MFSFGWKIEISSLKIYLSYAKRISGLGAMKEETRTVTTI